MPMRAIDATCVIMLFVPFMHCLLKRNSCHSSTATVNPSTSKRATARKSHARALRAHTNILAHA
eukprot:3469615-Lingulodinium_polyedra.AAC.1